MSIIRALITRFILSIAFNVKIEISDVTVFANSSEKLDKAKNDGISKEILTKKILEIISNERSFNFSSVHSQTLIL